MAFKIGFTLDNGNVDHEEKIHNTQNATTPRRSVVQVYFESRNMKLAYYNDKFDLHVGDIVFVDGKLEGKRGLVTEVNYNFKIKISDYKRVIAVADTDVKGQFFTAGSHFVTFEPSALPVSKVKTWFKAPAADEDEFVSSYDDTSFMLDDPNSMNISPDVAERGYEYYYDNHVKYLCLDGTHGYAIVEGSEAYEVEFEYTKGEIRNLVCSCFCSYNCKHEFAAMLQLRDTLKHISKHYEKEFESSGFFAAIDRSTLFSVAVDGKERGSFTL